MDVGKSTNVKKGLEDMSKIHQSVLIVVGMLLVAQIACSAPQPSETGEKEEGQSVALAGEAEPGEKTGLANPASVYCEEQGNTLELRTDSDGGQYGMCIFPDGSECEEWAYFRGECGPGGEAGESDTVLPATGGDMVQVVGWMGHVVSTPDGAEFDDYVVLSPEGAGEVGISGSSAELEAQIADLRDKEEPGKYANFWGTLTCGVTDYNGCQLLVEEIRVGTEITDPEPITGWVGTLVSNPPDAQFDDAFVLSGDYPVSFGIDSGIGESGERDLADDLEALRDTGTVFSISGDMICGVPDVNGCQIQVTEMGSVN
jgi:putative hemolysin